MIIEVGIFESCIGLFAEFYFILFYFIVCLQTVCKHTPLSHCSQIACKYQYSMFERPSYFRIIAFPSEETMQIYKRAGK